MKNYQNIGILILLLTISYSMQGQNFKLPLWTVSLKKYDVFEYDYYLIIGELNEIRSEIYTLNESLK